MSDRYTGADWLVRLASQLAWRPMSPGYWPHATAGDVLCGPDGALELVGDVNAGGGQCDCCGHPTTKYIATMPAGWRVASLANLLASVQP